MNLTELIQNLPINFKIDLNFEVKGISDSSKEISEDWIFVAIKGFKNDGNNYINDAIVRGAKLIISDSIDELQKNKIIVKVSNSRNILIRLLKKFYAPRSENIVAVTGTNGKSSSVDFYRSIFELLGEKSASIGTIGIISKWAKFEDSSAQMTTPSISVMYNILAKICEKSVNYVALEASSHGLDQGRLEGIDFKTAAFTSFTNDHLDYHSSMEHYLKSKLKIFEQISQNGTMIFNNDLPENVIESLKKISLKKNIKIITYGKKQGSDFRIISIEKEKDFQIFEIEYQRKIYRNKIELIGEFQIYNLLASMSLAISTGAVFEKIWSIIPNIKTAEGRMEKIIHPNLKAHIYIDYAHTENALELILKDIKEYSPGKLKLLFGCGGDRDKNRRSGMGKVANLLADEIFITDDNPRNEDPAQIRKEIREYCPRSFEIADRREAIKFAIKTLEPEDILIIAGKGHENYNLIENVKYYFSDKEEVIKALS